MNTGHTYTLLVRAVPFLIWLRAVAGARSWSHRCCWAHQSDVCKFSAALWLARLQNTAAHVRYVSVSEMSQGGSMKPVTPLLMSERPQCYDWLGFRILQPMFGTCRCLRCHKAARWNLWLLSWWASEPRGWWGQPWTRIPQAAPIVNGSTWPSPWTECTKHLARDPVLSQSDRSPWARAAHVVAVHHGLAGSINRPICLIFILLKHHIFYYDFKIEKIY
jgi:hypothetical protein